MDKEDLPQRHSIRLYGYDYSQEGVYFVTICVKDKACLFGDIVDEEMEFSVGCRDAPCGYPQYRKWETIRDCPYNAI